MSVTRDAAEQARLQTRVAGLDTVLRGGLVQGSVYIVQGRPGSGKTILANQVCFRHAAAGGRALYVTLLAESHARMLQNIGTLSFFDRALVAKGVYYISAFKELDEGGLPALLEVLRREMAAHSTTLLVIDGVLNAAETADSKIGFKKFVHAIQAQAVLTGCTVLLLTSARLEQSSPEMTIVDGIIELYNELLDLRPFRRIVVPKFRGGAQMLGAHAFEITDQGISVYPRTEALLARPSHPERADPRRLSSGVSGFDHMLGGGFPAASTTLILGPSGVGKTILGLHFLSRSTPDEPGLHVGFYEAPERLAAKGERIGARTATLAASGAVEVLWHSATENIIDALGKELLDAVERRKVKRLFIDGWDGFRRAAAHPDRLTGFFTALVNELRARGVTTIVTAEMTEMIGPAIRQPIPELSTIVENLVLMRFVELDARLHRLISILKLRDSGFDESLREFSIGGQGIQLGDVFREAERVMSGQPHRLAARADAPASAPAADQGGA